MNTFGERFKNERQKKELTQEELARMFLLQKSSISRYENNKQMPETDLLKKIADFFGVSVDYLLAGDSDNLHSISKADKEMIEAFNDYSKLSDSSKKIIDLMINELLKKQEK